MARQKTMVSLDPCGTDVFNDRSFEAQALWLQANLAADGMGAIDSMKRVLRQTGMSTDALQELLDAGLIIETDYFGSPVYFVTHFWVMNRTQGKRTYFGRYLSHAVENLTFQSKEYHAYTQLGTQETSNIPASLNVNEINELKEKERKGEGSEQSDGEAPCPVCGKPAPVHIEGSERYIECAHCRKFFGV